jgi:hypothetical protein
MLRLNHLHYAVLVAALSAEVLIPAGCDRESPAPIIAVETFQLESGQRIALKSSISAEASGLGADKPTSAIKPHFVKQIDWSEKGIWVKTDTHIHTTFSDGSNSVEDVVLKAKSFGCDVIAITDHSDRNLKAATPEYLEAIEASRRQHSEMIILAGVEWNIPPWGGDEHATVLVSPDVDELKTLSVFKSRFDDLGLMKHKAELAEEALRWLEANAEKKGGKPVVIYNHPSRKNDSSLEAVKNIIAWRKINDLVIGFEGAPGHQGNKSIGSYRYKVKTIDRWDPVVATVGDAWDTLLGKGIDVWGARADSDFHNNRPNDLNDFWPGQFSETWLYVPKRSPNAVLQAYRAGSFFGAHGHIARQVELTVEAEGLPRRAYPGEAIALPAGKSITVRVKCVVPAKDWRGRPNRVDTVELISINKDSASIIAKKSLSSDGIVQFDSMEVPKGGLVLRARGRRILSNAPHLLFCTNPIRIQTDN